MPRIPLLLAVALAAGALSVPGHAADGDLSVSTRFSNQAQPGVTEAALTYLQREYVSKTALPPSPITLGRVRTWTEGPFAYLEGCPQFRDGSPVPTEFMADVCPAFCLFQAADGAWEVAADLTSTDVPNLARARSIWPGIPRGFPVQRLPAHWSRLFQQIQRERAAAEGPAPATRGEMAVVFDPPVNLRASPRGPILLSITAVREVTVLSRRGDWWQCELDGTTGYIHRSQLRSAGGGR